jgi:hypothetical protein
MSFLNLVSAKRNRSDNFEADDIELLVGLVSEHTDIDSTKFEARRQVSDVKSLRERFKICFIARPGSQSLPNLMQIVQESNGTSER